MITGRPYHKTDSQYGFHHNQNNIVLPVLFNSLTKLINNITIHMIYTLL